MSNRIFRNVYPGGYDVKKVTYSKQRVDIILNSSVSFNLSLNEIMNLILENYDKFVADDFHAFARKVAFCDMKLTQRENDEERGGEDEYEDFNW